ncbi:hypothetical protein V8E36_008186 [Tilletia maclaganii]
MFGLSVIGAAIASTNHSSSAGTSIQLPPKNLRGHTIPLFQQISRAQFESKSEDDMHAYIKAEADRVTAKYHHIFHRFREATDVNHFLDARSEEIEKRTETEVPLIAIPHRAVWVGMISIGNGPGQGRLTAKFDISSVQTVVHHGQYDRRYSLTARNMGTPFEMIYIDGNRARGRVVLDSVYVEGLEADDVALGVATESTVSPDDCDVIVGMASLRSSHASALGRFGLVPTLLAQHSIEYNLLGFGLWKHGGAHLDIGHIPSEYRDRISWTPVLNPELGVWKASFVISGVGGAQIGVVDTGSSVIVGPRELVRDVILAAGMGLYEQDGRTYGTYNELGPRPRVSINIAGLNVVLSAESLAHGTREGLTVACIIGVQNTGGRWLLGTTFLQNVYAVFDGDHQMLGFVPR